MPIEMVDSDWMAIGERWAAEAVERYEAGGPVDEAIRWGKFQMTEEVEGEGFGRWSDEWDAAEDGFIEEWNRLHRASGSCGS